MLYRDLHQDTTLRESNDTLNDFYNLHHSSTIGFLMDIEEAIELNDFASALSALSAFTASTNIQQNYKDFYTLLISYSTAGSLITKEKATLETLAAKCPFIDGPVIYNSRALNNLVLKRVVIYNYDGCREGRGARFASHAKIDLNHVDYNIFPNPAIDEVLIVANNAKDNFLITITDVNGKQLLVKNLSIENYQATLKFCLQNGIYFVTFFNSNNERIVKKLVIAK